MVKKESELPEPSSSDAPRPVTAPASTTPSALTPTHSRFKSLFNPFKKGTSKPHTKTVTLSEYYHSWSSQHTASIAIYPEGVQYSFYLLISLMLLDTKKDDWKKIQSSNTSEELQAILNADLTGNLPAYTPARTTSKTKRDRRPRTANLHPTVSATDRWRWNTAGNDHDRDGNPLNVNPNDSQTTAVPDTHNITQ